MRTFMGDDHRQSKGRVRVTSVSRRALVQGAVCLAAVCLVTVPSLGTVCELVEGRILNWLGTCPIRRGARDGVNAADW